MKKLIMLLTVAALILTPVCAQALSVGDWGGWPTVGMRFGNQFAGYLSYNYYGSTSRSWMLAKVDCNLAKLGDVQTKAGVYYWTNSPNISSQVGLTWGAAIMPVNNFSVGFDIILAEANMAPGASSTTDILPGAVFTANLNIL